MHCHVDVVQERHFHRRYKVVATIPGEQAYTKKAETKCALWK